MRFLYLIFVTIPLALVIVSFAVSNRDPIGLQLWPLPQELVVPGFLVALVPLAAGILLGGLIAWLSGGKHRYLARSRKDKLDELGRKVISLQERQASLDEAARREAEQARVASAARSANDAAQLERPSGGRALPAADTG